MNNHLASGLGTIGPFCSAEGPTCEAKQCDYYFTSGKHKCCRSVEHSETYPEHIERFLASHSGLADRSHQCECGYRWRFLTPEQRDAVVSESRSWVDAHTPYIAHARKKGLGCDCATFILCVYRDIGLVEDVDLGHYSIQAHLHKPLNEEHEKQLTQYVDTILRYADEITEAEAQPGDMVLFKVARAFAHGAIVIQWPIVAHAAIGHGVVLADVSTDPQLQRRVRRFFRRNFEKS